MSFNCCHDFCYHHYYSCCRHNHHYFTTTAPPHHLHITTSPPLHYITTTQSPQHHHQIILYLHIEGIYALLTTLNNDNEVTINIAMLSDSKDMWSRTKEETTCRECGLTLFPPYCIKWGNIGCYTYCIEWGTIGWCTLSLSWGCIN